VWEGVIQLTNSMGQSPSEAKNHSAARQIPHLVWDPKVHYRVHKGTALLLFTSHINPVHILPF